MPSESLVFLAIGMAREGYWALSLGVGIALWQQRGQILRLIVVLAL